MNAEWKPTPKQMHDAAHPSPAVGVCLACGGTGKERTCSECGGPNGTHDMGCGGFYAADLPCPVCFGGSPEMTEPDAIEAMAEAGFAATHQGLVTWETLNEGEREFYRTPHRASLRALLDGGYVVLTDQEPLIIWSEAKPGVGMVRLAGRTLVVVEQDVFRRLSSESPKEPR